MRRQLQALATACGEEGTGPQIHRLRVVLRRTRFWARLGRPWLPASARESFENWGRRVAALTAQVRDLDAAQEWLRSRRAGAEIRRGFVLERTTEWRRQKRRWRPMPEQAMDALGLAEAAKEAGRRLRRRVRKFEQRFEDELVETLPRFFKLGVADQHEVRRVVRRWRYLREMLASPAEQARDRLLRALLAVQETVGDHQNLQVVLDHLERLAPVGKGRTRLLRTAKLARQRQVRRIKTAIRGLLRELE